MNKETAEEDQVFSKMVGKLRLPVMDEGFTTGIMRQIGRPLVIRRAVLLPLVVVGAGVGFWFVWDLVTMVLNWLLPETGLPLRP